MNNDQFRKLVSSNSNQNASSDTNSLSSSAISSGQLGSRQRSSIGLTPRNAKGATPLNFAREFATNNALQRPGKQYRSSAPKGSRLGAGYQDRTLERHDEDKDDKAQRIKNLEKSLKDEEIDDETFNRLRDEITGGDVENTHLVKGLDWKLLEKIKRGDQAEPESADLDDEFDQLEKQEIKAAPKEEKVEKKGIMAPPPIAGKKRMRDEILAELKASRKKTVQEKPAPELGSRFRKIIHPEPLQKPTVPDKRQKSKHAIPEDTTEVAPALIPLDHDAVVPTPKTPPEEESDDDIYADVGDEYNPLGDMDDDDDEAVASKPTSNPPINPQAPAKKIFDDDSTSVLSKVINPLQDPAYLALLSQRSQATKDPEPPSDLPHTDDPARLARRAAMLSTNDRDLEDMDMGFGSSRFDDAEDMAWEGSKGKLAEWRDGKGMDDDDDDGEGGEKKGKKGGPRKRGPKKRKGDKNSMADVMRVIEGRK